MAESFLSYFGQVREMSQRKNTGRQTACK